MTPNLLADAIEILHCREDSWDSEDWMGEDIVFGRPPGRFVMAMQAIDPEALPWLVYFAARRGLSCWGLSCEESRPRDIVEALGRHLREGAAVDWEDAMKAEPSPFDDCRYSDTQSAANAVAEAAQFLHRRDIRHAIYCLSAAAIAYEHVLVNDRFRQWLAEVAVPVAMQKREMTASEQEALRAEQLPA